MQVKGQRTSKDIMGRLAFIALAVLFTGAGVFAAIRIITIHAGYARAQEEYESLRQYAPTPAPAATPTPSPTSPTIETEATAPPTPAATPAAEARPDLSDINPDYIGWLNIAGTGIDYPVARGVDNEKYLNTTFAGEKNPSGAIFLDMRCDAGFASPLAVVYGHNMKDGSMFAGLHAYREAGYKEAHPSVNLTTPNGTTHTYRVFAARETDVADGVFWLFNGNLSGVKKYFTGHGAPADAERFLVLSTCITDLGDDARLLIFAAEE